MFCRLKNVPHICTMNDAHAHSEYAANNAHEHDTQGAGPAHGETCDQLRIRMGVKIRTIQTWWVRAFGYSYSRNRVCTPEEIARVEAFYLRKEKTVRVPIARTSEAANTPEPNEVPGLTVETKPVETTKEQAIRPAFLWAVLALAMSVSVPNMYGVMAAVKGNQALAGMATAAFTIAPFLLILARVRGWWYGVIYLVVGVEVFCNCAGFYGGLTGLQHSLYVEPTTFLHMVTTMTNSANEQTALLLSVFFSVAIAALAIAPVENLKKLGG